MQEEGNKRCGPQLTERIQNWKKKHAMIELVYQTKDKKTKEFKLVPPSDWKWTEIENKATIQCKPLFHPLVLEAFKFCLKSDKEHPKAKDLISLSYPIPGACSIGKDTSERRASSLLSTKLSIALQTPIMTCTHQFSLDSGSSDILALVDCYKKEEEDICVERCVPLAIVETKLESVDQDTLAQAMGYALECIDIVDRENPAFLLITWAIGKETRRTKKVKLYGVSFQDNTFLYSHIFTTDQAELVQGLSKILYTLSHCSRFLVEKRNSFEVWKSVKSNVVLNRERVYKYLPSKEVNKLRPLYEKYFDELDVEELPYKKGSIISYKFVEGEHHATYSDQVLALAKYLQQMHKNGHIHKDIRMANMVFNHQFPEKSRLIDLDMVADEKYPQDFREDVDDGKRSKNAKAGNLAETNDDWFALGETLFSNFDVDLSYGIIWVTFCQHLRDSKCEEAFKLLEESKFELKLKQKSRKVVQTHSTRRIKLARDSSKHQSTTSPKNSPTSSLKRFLGSEESKSNQEEEASSKKKRKLDLEETITDNK